MTIDDFIRFSLRDRLGRLALNRTGLAGRFDFHLEYAPDEIQTAAAPFQSAGPSIFTALQRQLGLRLEPAKGLQEVLVIDHVERPSAN